MWFTIKSSASAPASEDSTSASVPDFEEWAALLERCAWWRGKPSQSRTWLMRCKRVDWMNVLFGLETSRTYPSKSFRPSTGSQGATPASRSAKQESGWGEKTLAICGPTSSDSPSLFDQVESSSRTSQAISRSALIKSFETWKHAVSAVRSACTQRRKSVPPTDANESSSSAWPTPRTPTGGSESAARKKELGRTNSGGGDLQSEVRNWPTATVGDSRNSARHTTTTGVMKDGTTLVDATRAWPTPTTQDSTNNGGPAQANRHNPGLNLMAGLPDPENPSSRTNRPGLLNPAWVETLMGFETGWTACEPSETQ